MFESRDILEEYPENVELEIIREVHVEARSGNPKFIWVTAKMINIGRLKENFYYVYNYQTNTF